MDLVALFAAERAARPDAPLYHPTDTHWNERAAALAEHVDDALRWRRQRVELMVRGGARDDVLGQPLPAIAPHRLQIGQVETGSKVSDQLVSPCGCKPLGLEKFANATCPNALA